MMAETTTRRPHVVVRFDYRMPGATNKERVESGTGLASQVLVHAETVEDLRSSGRYLVDTPEGLVERAGAGLRLLSLHPLCGGVPPDAAAESLQLVADKVLPNL